MEILTNIALVLIGVLLFEFIIFAHEFGHFITAKKSGVQVNEFALGMGPKLFSFTKGETTYSLRLFPIGGYCAMEGEDADSDNPRAFNNAKVWKRMIIIVAGAFMNIVVGFILVFITTVNTAVFVEPVITGFQPDAFTAVTGLQEGDRILSVDGYSVANSQDLALGIQLLQCKTVDPDSLEIYKEDCLWDARVAIQRLYNDGKLDEEKANALYGEHLQALAQSIRAAQDKASVKKLYEAAMDGIYQTAGAEKPKAYTFDVPEQRQRYTGDIKVERDGEAVTLHDVQFYTYRKADDKRAVAIDFSLQPKEKNFVTVMQETFTGTVSQAKSVWKSLEMLVRGRFSLNDMSGPVGITKAVSDVAAAGLKTGFGDAVLNIIFIMALITVNLGIINMLPFPALDGGRFVFLLIEAIIRRPIPRKVEYIVNGIGMALLIALIIFISGNDIYKLITGQFQSIE